MPDQPRKSFYAQLLDTLWNGYKTVADTLQEDPDGTVIKGKDILVRYMTTQDEPIPSFIQINGRKVAFNGRETQDSGRYHSALPLNALSIDEHSFRKYRIGQQDLLLFTAGYYHCNGSGCGVTFYLIYDLNRKQLNAFYLFRMEELAFLGDADGDLHPDFISMQHEGFGPPDSFEVRLFSLDRTGRFVLRKNKGGIAYSIRGVYTGMNGDSFNYRILYQDWLKPIDTAVWNNRLY